MFVYITCFVISVYHSLAVEEKRRTSSVCLFHMFHYFCIS